MKWADLFPAYQTSLKKSSDGLESINKILHSDCIKILKSMNEIYLHFCSSQLSEENFSHHFSQQNYKNKSLNVQNLHQNRNWIIILMPNLQQHSTLTTMIYDS